jgi:uncharacterized integral membrane protein (TIGR00698 family)
VTGRAESPAALGPAPLGPGPLALAQDALAGVVLCGVIALAATFVARVHGGPQFLYALLFGMALHGIGQEGRAARGIEFCSRFVLRLGVALLGARIAAEQVLALGWATAALVVAGVFSTIAGGAWLARRLGLTLEQGLVSGGATAICGASAALAISAVLPRSREQERFTLLVVVCVSTLSTLAMLVYPLGTTLLGWSAPQAGLFLGASIHDVAQVMGAAYLLGPTAGDTAVIVKLFRVGLLVVVVAGIGLVLRPPAAGERRARAVRRVARLPGDGDRRARPEDRPALAGRSGLAPAAADARRDGMAGRRDRSRRDADAGLALSRAGGALAREGERVLDRA